MGKILNKQATKSTRLISKNPLGLIVVFHYVLVEISWLAPSSEVVYRACRPVAFRSPICTKGINPRGCALQMFQPSFASPAHPVRNQVTLTCCWTILLNMMNANCLKRTTFSIFLEPLGLLQMRSQRQNSLKKNLGEANYGFRAVDRHPISVILTSSSFHTFLWATWSTFPRWGVKDDWLIESRALEMLGNNIRPVVREFAQYLDWYFCSTQPLPSKGSPFPYFYVLLLFEYVSRTIRSSLLASFSSLFTSLSKLILGLKTIWFLQ